VVVFTTSISGLTCGFRIAHSERQGTSDEPLAHLVVRA
jgi:hypothetical protein